VACVEQGAGELDASASDAGTTEPGTFFAGRLTQSHRALSVVPQGRELVQALSASDSLLIYLSPGGARLHLDSGSVEILPTQINSQFSVTLDQSWLLWLIDQKGNAAGTRSLVAAPFPAGGTRHGLLGDVFRHHFVQGPRVAGADVVAIAAVSDGTNHLMTVGPDLTGAALSMDLGSWTGTTADKLDASSGGGYAVVADTQGTALLSLLAPGPPCLLSASPLPSSQVLTVPGHDSVLWVDAAAGVAGTGYRGKLSDCAAAQTFATSATSLEVDADRYLLYLDSSKHLLRLDLASPGATPVSMRDADEVVYRWAYVPGEDVLLLDMTSVFDTAERLYVLRQPFLSK
jgi:hypothetical protein